MNPVSTETASLSANAMPGAMDRGTAEDVMSEHCRGTAIADRAESAWLSAGATRACSGASSAGGAEPTSRQSARCRPAGGRPPGEDFDREVLPSVVGRGVACSCCGGCAEGGGGDVRAARIFPRHWVSTRCCQRPLQASETIRCRRRWEEEEEEEEEPVEPEAAQAQGSRAPSDNK